MEEGGEEALTLRRLARETGMSANTIYRHFGGARDDIIDAIVMDAYAAVTFPDDSEISLDEPGKGPWDIAMDTYLDNGSFFKAVILCDLRGPRVSDAKQNLRHLYDQSLELLETAKLEGVLTRETDVNFLGHHFLRLFQSMAAHWARDEIDANTFRTQFRYAVYSALFVNASSASRDRFARVLSEITSNAGALPSKKSHRQDG